MCQLRFQEKACAREKIIGIMYNIISLIVLWVVTVGTMTTRKEDKRGRKERLVYKVQKRGDHVIWRGDRILALALQDLIIRCLHRLNHIMWDMEKKGFWNHKVESLDGYVEEADHPDTECGSCLLIHSLRSVASKMTQDTRDTRGATWGCAMRLCSCSFSSPIVLIIWELHIHTPAMWQFHTLAKPF